MFFGALAAARKRLHPVLAQHKLDLAVHVLVVDRLALLEVDAPARLVRFLVEARAPVLIEDALLAQHTIDHTARVLHVVVLHQHGARNEAGVSQDHGCGVLKMWRVVLDLLGQRERAAVTNRAVFSLFWFSQLRLCNRIAVSLWIS